MRDIAITATAVADTVNHPPASKQLPTYKLHASAVFILEPTATSSNITGSSNNNNAITLSNEYGKSSTCADLQALLRDTVGYRRVEVLPISLDSVDAVADFCLQQCPDRDCVVVNLCDGCETDGYPGVSVLRALQRRQLPYTGADPVFYDHTTSKPVLKRLLIAHGVPTSPFVELVPGVTTTADIDALAPYPLIVKPSISYASISISDTSVVFSAQAALDQAARVQGVDDGVFVERFLSGREFTALVVSTAEGGLRVHTVAERVFNPNLREHQRILAFDRYWAGYDLTGNTPHPDTEKVYWYAQAPADWQPMLQDIAKQAFHACGGSGYGRVDMRTDGMESRSVFVLEVNANCGVSFNPAEAASTVSEILRMSNESLPSFANELVGYAVHRQRVAPQ